MSYKHECSLTVKFAAFCCSSSQDKNIEVQHKNEWIQPTDLSISFLVTIWVQLLLVAEWQTKLSLPIRVWNVIHNNHCISSSTPFQMWQPGSAHYAQQDSRVHVMRGLLSLSADHSELLTPNPAERRATYFALCLSFMHSLS